MNYIALFFAGLFLCNCIPLLVCGLKGEPFPTPFATPRGVGNSSPLLNFFWGIFNLVVGSVLLSYFPVQVGINVECIAFLAGSLAIGVYLSLHFGKVRATLHGK